MMLRKRLSPDDALAIGLVDGVYPPDQLMPKVMELANELSEKAPLAVRAVIRAVRAHLEKGIDAGLQVETDEVAIVTKSADAVEGFTAFMEKRKPNFKGE